VGYPDIATHEGIEFGDRKRQVKLFETLWALNYTLQKSGQLAYNSGNNAVPIAHKDRDAILLAERQCYVLNLGEGP
jgi:hypothetical protein